MTAEGEPDGDLFEQPGDTWAKKKLREAEYFLGRAQALGRNEGPDREDFEFNLNAFLSAARSVRFVLEYEMSARYKAVFPGWSAELKSDDRVLCDFMNDQRVGVVHHSGSADHEAVLEWLDLPQWIAPRPGRYQPSVRWMAPRGQPAPQIGVKRFYFTIGGARVPVLDAGARYLDLMRELLGIMYLEPLTG